MSITCELAVIKDKLLSIVQDKQRGVFFSAVKVNCTDNTFKTIASKSKLETASKKPTTSNNL